MKTHMKHVRGTVLNRGAVVAAAAALLCAAPSVWALGLGRLSVQSAVGEPLRAEIDVTSLTPEEASNLRARVAPPESYRVAGVDYSPVLPTTNVVLQRRPDGSAFLRLTSDRPVQEPFVDVILELSWASGRLSREYTLLFDPPVGSRAPAPAVTTLPVAPAPVVSAPVTPPPAVVARPAPAPAPAAREEEVVSAPRKAAVREKPARVEREESAPSGDQRYRVRPGDTLSRIAARVPHKGVSLDQMLVGLYRNNESAFIGNNMNRLRSGVVLNLPSASQLDDVSPAEARKVISAQSSDFNGYRQRLAKAVPATTEAAAPSRRAAGKVQTEVEDHKQTTAPTQDRLKLDKGRVAASGPTLEDKVVKERASKEASSRVEELNRNVAALKQLQAGASAAGGAASAATGAVVGKVVSAASSVAAAPAKAASAVVSTAASAAASAPKVSVPASAPVVLPKPASAPVAASAPVVPASAFVPASAPVVEPRKTEQPAPPPVVQLPAEDSEGDRSLMERVAESPFALPGAGLLLAGLVGLGWYRFRGRNKDEPGVTSFLESRLQPDSFFGASGGQRVDTRDSGAASGSSQMSYSLSQIDAIGDVDPVAEADVYLAYGRDLQAEEILKEAMRSNPERLAIRTKLLEVYAKRRDTKGFELLAGELYGLTGGQGEDWAKAQEMGRSIDPDNPLYEPGGQPAHGSTAEAGGGEMLGAATMPQTVVPTSSRLDDVPDITLEEAGPSSIMDLDISEPGPITDMPEPTASGFQVSSLPDLDLSETVASARATGVTTTSGALDFELSDMPTAPVQAPVTAPSLDLSDISLDLDKPSTMSEPAPLTGMSTSGMGLTGLDDLEDDTDPLARKLELAEEFHQIGDYEGARDLLAEVLEKAEGPLKAKAQAMFDSLN